MNSANSPITAERFINVALKNKAKSHGATGKSKLNPACYAWARFCHTHQNVDCPLIVRWNLNSTISVESDHGFGQVAEFPSTEEGLKAAIQEVKKIGIAFSEYSPEYYHQGRKFFELYSKKNT